MPTTLPESVNPANDGAADPLRLMPRSRAAQVAVWVMVVLLGVLVFGSWLRPNMVFDFADMVFCN